MLTSDFIGINYICVFRTEVGFSDRGMANLWTPSPWLWASILNPLKSRTRFNPFSRDLNNQTTRGLEHRSAVSEICAGTNQDSAHKGIAGHLGPFDIPFLFYSLSWLHASKSRTLTVEIASFQNNSWSPQFYLTVPKILWCG